MEIIFKEVDFKYNNNLNFEKEIFNKINLKIKKNQVSIIMGKSGSGKTTLLELIAGLIIPNEGEIIAGDYIFPKDIKKVKEFRSQVGMILENPEEQFFNLTVFKEIEFALLGYKYQVAEKEKEIINVLKLVELDVSYLNRSLDTLSSGEQRRVALAFILVFKPQVIILDNPTKGLDNKGKINLIRLIRQLKSEHKTIVIASNDVEFVHKIADNIIMLGNKQVVLKGDKYEVFSQMNEVLKWGVGLPKIMDFSNRVLQNKKLKIGYRDEINDLLKDIYRYAK